MFFAMHCHSAFRGSIGAPGLNQEVTDSRRPRWAPTVFVRYQPVENRLSFPQVESMVGVLNHHGFPPAREWRPLAVATRRNVSAAAMSPALRLSTATMRPGVTL